ncbi:Uncharacterised protein [Mycobacteroides abscessus subsp. massiliense]|nr:Uncharacterised protein [Mycobacteroides abscessus subsp. massiliense]
MLLRTSSSCDAFGVLVREMITAASTITAASAATTSASAMTQPQLRFSSLRGAIVSGVAAFGRAWVANGWMNSVLGSSPTGSIISVLLASKPGAV